MVKDNAFYFLKDSYFHDFPDKNLMKNHEKVGTQLHNRPCFYAFKDDHNSNIYWMIPISSKVDKYERIRNAKIAKHGSCETIAMGYVLNKKRAFLLQNICPVTEKYLSEQYVVNNKSVSISNKFQKELKTKAKHVLSLYYTLGKKYLIFPDIEKIQQKLIQQLELEKKQETEKKPQVQEKPKPIRRGGRVAPMQFPPSTRQPLAPIKRKTVKPKQPAAENVQQVQPKPKTKRKLVLEPKPNTDDRYRGR